MTSGREESHGINSRLRTSFLGALLAGVVGIAFGYLFNSNLATIALPLGAMAIYAYVGWLIDRTNLETQQFADSLYYLGFLFTLVALVVSLYSFVGGSEVDTTAIIARFSTALITTVFGLSARVVLLNFREDFEETVRRSEAALADASQTLRARLEEISVTMLGQNELMSSTFKRSLEESCEAIGSATASASDALGAASTDFASAISESATTLGDSVSRASAGVDLEISQASTSLAATSAAAGEALSSAVLQVKTRLSEAEIPSDVFVRLLQPAVDRLNSGLESHVEAVAELTRQQNATNIETTKLASQLAVLAEKSRDVHSSLTALGNAAASAANLAASTQEADRQITAIGETLRSSTDKIAKISAITAKHAEDLKGQLSAAERRRSRLEEESEAAQARLATVANTLVDAAEYIKSELKPREKGLGDAE